MLQGFVLLYQELRQQLVSLTARERNPTPCPTQLQLGWCLGSFSPFPRSTSVTVSISCDSVFTMENVTWMPSGHLLALPSP